MHGCSMTGSTHKKENTPPETLAEKAIQQQTHPNVKGIIAYQPDPFRIGVGKQKSRYGSEHPKIQRHMILVQVIGYHFIGVQGDF